MTQKLEDAMCLWEVIVDLKIDGYNSDNPTALQQAVLDWEVGAIEQRHTVAGWVDTCNEAYEYAIKYLNYEDCFDYEFCPWFVKYCIDHDTWSIRRDWKDQVRNTRRSRIDEMLHNIGIKMMPDYTIVRREGQYGSNRHAWKHVIQKVISGNPDYKEVLEMVKEHNAKHWRDIENVAFGTGHEL